MSEVVNDLAFQRMSAAEARDHRAEVEDIFRASYVEAIDSGEEFESPEAFMKRFDAYTDPSRASGFELVMARIGEHAVGQTWGWPLGPRSQWWNGLRLGTGDLATFTAEDGTRTFALSETMVQAEFTGHGIARALHDDLLGRRPEQRATLLVQPDNRRAYDTYRRWGWARVGVLTPSWPDAPTFDALIRELH
ncbi:GNAT family N-acetyltransferase [Nocardia sp. NPDC051787]|uniref:GNAT family N-acetyltransferase n=1 Tax=Nocardia sp. NPDC051787 TaxID=3155415 RepID=UPI0034178DE9